MNHGAPFSPSPPGIRVTRSVYSAAVGEEMALSLAGGLRCGLYFLDWAQDSALFYYVLGVKVHALLPRGCIETPIAHPKKKGCGNVDGSGVATPRLDLCCPSRKLLIDIERQPHKGKNGGFGGEAKALLLPKRSPGCQNGTRPKGHLHG